MAISQIAPLRMHRFRSELLQARLFTCVMHAPASPSRTESGHTFEKADPAGVQRPEVSRHAACDVDEGQRQSSVFRPSVEKDRSHTAPAARQISMPSLLHDRFATCVMHAPASPSRTEPGQAFAKPEPAGV